jgi:NADH-quinone oxidoreductase subunit F
LPGDDPRGLDRDEEPQYRVHLCFGPNCAERGSRVLMPVLERAVREAGLGDSVEVLATTCRNRCDDGPSLNVYPGPVFYNRLHAEAIREIVSRHLAEGEIVEHWRYGPGMASRTRR